MEQVSPRITTPIGYVTGVTEQAPVYIREIMAAAFDHVPGWQVWHDKSRSPFWAWGTEQPGMIGLAVNSDYHRYVNTRDTTGLVVKVLDIGVVAPRDWFIISQ
jgi:hypothetical protein